jgi:hypothetical protein
LLFPSLVLYFPCEALTAQRVHPHSNWLQTALLQPLLSSYKVIYQ